MNSAPLDTSETALSPTPYPATHASGIHVPRIHFSRNSGLDELVRVFHESPAVALRQYWLNEPEEGFRPASVKVCWRARSLCFFAEMEDDDIFNAAQNLNEQAFLLGDVFEVFLKSPHEEHYVEIHVTPNNQRLQLRIPRQGEARAAQAISDPAAVFSRAWIHPEGGRWFVYLEIPAHLVTGTSSAGGRFDLQFSCARDDYTRGKESPFRSSSSPHPYASFHLVENWGILRVDGL